MPHFQTRLLHKKLPKIPFVFFFFLCCLWTPRPPSAASSLLSPCPWSWFLVPADPLAQQGRQAGLAVSRRELLVTHSLPGCKALAILFVWSQGSGSPCRRGLIPPGGHRGNQVPQNLLRVPHPTPGHHRSCLAGCSCPPCAAPGARADSWNLTELDNHRYYF